MLVVVRINLVDDFIKRVFERLLSHLKVLLIAALYGGSAYAAILVIIWFVDLVIVD